MTNVTIDLCRIQERNNRHCVHFLVDQRPIGLKIDLFKNQVYIEVT